ncbi:hypothetical protein LCGC14_1569500, partial [marine sediment metagenome]
PANGRDAGGQGAPGNRNPAIYSPVSSSPLSALCASPDSWPCLRASPPSTPSPSWSAMRHAPSALKWPNDVLLRGGKVAGILLESVGDHLAIGIGVNLAHAPEAGTLEARALPAVTLREAGANVTAEDFLNVLAQEYAGLEDQFTTYGFATIRSAWLAHAARLGEVITARTMRDEITGVFEDVDSAGNLILRTRNGAVPITAADVFF